eukprot:1525269-Amphidinium_carterae.1
MRRRVQFTKAVYSMYFMHHPTSGYDHLTTELKKLYKHFVFCDIYNDLKEDSELCFRLMRYIPNA